MSDISIIQFSLLAFVAGILTIAAPCSLALLPVIIGTSLGSKSIKNALIIILSLVFSIILFSIVLRSAITFIIIDPRVIAAISGSLLLFVGLTLLFHNQWSILMVKLGASNKSAELLKKSKDGSDKPWRSILVGAALGPVFTSCSPTFAIVLAVILPQSFAKGVWLMVIYAIGLGITLLLIALLGFKGRKLLNPLSNPSGPIRKGIGILLIIVGIFIIFGIDKQIEIALIESGFLGTTKLEVGILEFFNLSF